MFSEKASWHPFGLKTEPRVASRKLIGEYKTSFLSNLNEATCIRAYNYSIDAPFQRAVGPEAGSSVLAPLKGRVQVPHAITITILCTKLKLSRAIAQLPAYFVLDTWSLPLQVTLYYLTVHHKYDHALWAYSPSRHPEGWWRIFPCSSRNARHSGPTGYTKR